MSELKLSLNKFGEYFTATPSRKETIIREAKYGKEAERGARYSKARKAIKKFFLAGFDKRVLEDELLSLNSISPKTEWQKSDKESSIQALNKVLEMNFAGLEKYSISEYKYLQKSIEIEGVEINVNPDFIFKVKDRNDVVNIGALKIHLSKNNALKDESIKNIAVILYQFLAKNNLKEGEILKPTMLFSYDVFSSNLGTASAKISTRWKNIEAACRSIKLYWDSI